MNVTIIIPTKDRASLLERLLTSITTQTLGLGGVEVLVMDNGSKDGTKSVADKFGDRIPNLRYILESEPGLHRVRNRGFLEAMFDVVVFVDDDMKLAPEWLEGLTESFGRSNEIQMVGGKILPDYEIEPPQWILDQWEPANTGDRFLGYLGIVDMGITAKFVNPFCIYGGNMAIRKSVLLDAGGFHPDALPNNLMKYRGDGESYVSSFMVERQYKAYFNPKMVTYHYIPAQNLTIGFFERRAYKQGVSDSYTSLRKLHLSSSGENKNSAVDRISLISLLRKWMWTLGYYRLRSIVAGKKRNYLINRAYKKGYRFHQDVVEKDPELLKYVLKRDYLQ